jgi:gliding motility-associated-like protein
MRKLYSILCCTLLWTSAVYARHIKGGEINYEYIGPGSLPNTDIFVITLRLFLECNASGQQLDEQANIGIYRIGDNLPVNGSPFNAPLVGDEFINISKPNPCIVNPSPVCYRLRTYVLTVELAKDPTGYTVVFQRCCRIEGLANLSPNNNIGSSYTCNIHGTNAIGTSAFNSSPRFAIKDTVLICQNRPFQLDFGAADPDKDSLSYEFINAFSAPGGGGGGVVNPNAPSTLSFVSYGAGFSGTQPLGPKVNINPGTGLIAGVAPSGGDYVISVLVTEWRGGKPISNHRKDFNIKVDERCDLAAALLKERYSTCDDFNFMFSNESPPSSLIHTYHWDFGVSALTNDTSNLQSPDYTYADTGIYTIKLYVNRNEQCSDSATSQLHVFPGFSPGFSVAGSCYQNPFVFTDTTTAKYGVVDKWRWDFGDPSTFKDTSNISNPSFKYDLTGLKQVQFTVSTSKGCETTITTNVDVLDKPKITLPFRDTLICSIDTLQLKANGNGSFSWSPGINLLDGNTQFPLVFPKSTTWYHVRLDEDGCINNDSIRVRVVDFVTLAAGPDTTICLTDPAQLITRGDGLRFVWTNASTLNDPNIASPVATPVSSTLYRVTASIGKCNATDDVFVRTVPYPFVDAGKDTTICFADTAHLKGSILASSFAWTPSGNMSNSSILDPVAYPRRTTTYRLIAFDTIGCPKPGTDDVVVNVKAKINAFAGNDTSIVVGQPLLLNGSGAELAEWQPSDFLSRNDIYSPTALLPDNMTYIMKAYTPEGCFAMDTINVKVFKTGPDIFMPNAFTPTGRNRLLRPIPVGIKQLDYFRVFNRYGQLMFQTQEVSRGWDGMIGGKIQPTGTYVWMVRGTDYLGKTIEKRGTALLVR